MNQVKSEFQITFEILTLNGKKSCLQISTGIWYQWFQVCFCLLTKIRINIMDYDELNKSHSKQSRNKKRRTEKEKKQQISNV